MGLRQPGQLTDTGETLQQRLERLAIPAAAAATPIGAVRAGATPDQAKMVRTQARLQSTVPQVLQPTPPPLTDQLATVTRQAKGQGEVVAQNLQPQITTTTALAGLSTLGQQRVQAAINERLNQLSQQPALSAQIIDTPQLHQLLGLTGTQAAEKATQIQQLQTLLTSYAAAPTQEKLVQLEQLRRSAGFKGDFTTDTGVRQFFKAVGQTVAGTAASQLQDQLTVADLDPTQLGFNSAAELAQVLGIPEPQLLNLTVEQLKQKVDQTARQQQQQADELRAKIAASPPGSAQRLVYERRLNNLLSGGALQVELKAAETAADIALTDRITVGGQQYTVAEILNDQKFSNLIERFLNAPDDDTRERLLPSQDFGPLREWLEANELGLQDILREVETTQQGWQQVLRDYKNLGNVALLGGHKDLKLTLDNDVVDAILGNQNLNITDGLITQTQLNQLKQVIQQSPIGTLIQDPANADLLQKIKPSDIIKFKTATNTWLPVSDIKNMFNTAQALKADPTAAKFFGISPDSEFLTKNQLTTYTNNLPLYNTVKNQYPGWLANSAFLNASLATKQLYVQNPQRFKQFEDATALKQKLTPGVLANTQQTFETLTGISPAQLSVTYNRLMHQASLGNRAAREKLEQFKSLLGGDGNPETRLSQVVNLLVSNLNNVNINTAAQGQANAVLSSIAQLQNARLQEVPKARSVYGDQLKWAHSSLSPDRFFDIVGQVVRPGEQITADKVIHIFNALKDTGAYAQYEHEGGHGRLVDAIMGDIVDELNSGDVASDVVFLQDWDHAREWMKSKLLNQDVTKIEQQLSGAYSIPNINGRINQLANQLGQIEVLMTQRPDLAQNPKVKELYNFYHHKLNFERYQKDVVEHEVPRLQQQWDAVKGDDGINTLRTYIDRFRRAQEAYNRAQENVKTATTRFARELAENRLADAEKQLGSVWGSLHEQFTWWNGRHKSGISAIKEIHDRYSRWGDGMPHANQDTGFNNLKHKINDMVDLLRQAASIVRKQAAV